MKCSRLHRRDRTDGRDLRSVRVRTLSQGRLLYTVTFALASLPARRSGRCRALTFISAVLAVVLGPEHLAHPCEEVLSQRLRLFRRQDLIRALDVEQRSEEHTSELQSRENLVCRLLLEKKKI